MLRAAIDKARHSLLIAGAATVLVAVEPLCGGTMPLLARLSPSSRDSLYGQLTTVSAGLLGFMITAVAILVSFDSRRQIVKELKRGESFALLIVNMLAAIVFLFATTVLGLAGPELDAGARAARAYEYVYEGFVVATVFELLLTGFYFAVVTYKVAAHRDEDA